MPQRPVLILMYGFPGSGKTYFARQFCNEVQAAHLEEDRIRAQLFENPNYSQQETHSLNRIMTYIASEFLTAGISVVYDMNAMRRSQRKALRELARTHKAASITIWFQVDADTAFLRNKNRDRRKLDDRFAAGYDVEKFKELASHMQHPEPPEDIIVISGKHTYPSQMGGVIKKLADLDIVKPTVAVGKMAKPALVNLIPPKFVKRLKNGKQNIVLR